ncbi:MAG TPA: ScyD/ScyE family protein [Thermomicrobiales bacterium]|nr:ScyD/ScyE family protein [Thermomicrobiales bacterium]
MHPLRFALVLCFLFAAPAVAQAQSSTPAASPAASPVASPGQVVATDLTNPRGFAWGADGALYVALAGNGGTSAAVVKIVDGKPAPVATGLPSAVSNTGSVLGVADVAFLDGQLYALVAGGGAENKHPDQPNGVYKIGNDGNATLVADLNAWVKNNPVASPPDHDQAGNPYQMIAGAGLLWVVIATPDQLVTVKPDGTITRVADFTTGGNHQVMTGIAAGGDGSVDIGTLSVFPFSDGTAEVFNVGADGKFSPKWTNLTAVTGVAIGPNGTLYAIEMTTGNTVKKAMNPGTGALVRQTGTNSAATVAAGFNFPIALRIGSDGLAYVAAPAVGADAGQGTIVKVPLS